MRTYVKRISVIMLGIVLTITTFALPARVDQPHMKAALDDLKQARSFLNKATPDKGGHRAKAIDLTVSAMDAVKHGIEWDRTHPGSTGLDEDVVITPVSDQPNMVAARKWLNAALDELNKATPNKGGYREQAIGLVQSAISEANAGIEFDRNH
jgi:hypothetical protein